MAMLRGEFDQIQVSDGEELDTYARRISTMAARHARLGATLGDVALVKKLLDSVPDRL